ncbi:MAG: 2-dehydro-3-deoxy-6-phosphogalactonate aldolase [Pseudomonadota bacterium]
MNKFDTAFARLPLVAILRGVLPGEVEAIAQALYEAGFRLIEVPLNSPGACDSIARVVRCLPGDALVGAGTIVNTDALRQVRDAGGALAVMPHTDVALIKVAKAAGMACIPGAATPTEAFAALHAGADAVKLFPAELVTPVVLRAMRAVLPASLRLLPVGGIMAETMDEFIKAGAAGFGLGSALYAPGCSAETVAARARDFVNAYGEYR